MDFLTWIRRLPWTLVAAWFALVICGWVGIAGSEELRGVPARFFRQQVAWSVVALGCMLLVTLPNYQRACRAAYAMFAVSLVLLALVYVFPQVNGARRWIRFAGIGFQPSEFAKLCYVLMLARYLMYRENFRRLPGLLMPLLLTLPPMLLILREPDLGTSLVFVPIWLAMLTVAGARRRDLALVVLTGILILPLLWSQMSREQRSRVTALLQQNSISGDASSSSDLYHLHQAKQLLALGGTWGSYWQGRVVDDRVVYHVPEGATDSVFAVLSERFGLAGGALLLLAYVFLISRILAIAGQTREPFGRLTAAGVAALFGVEAIINTGMMVGLLPITGLSLPLVSYGGSGLVSHSLALGLVLNIGLRPGYEVTPEPFLWRAAKPA